MSVPVYVTINDLNDNSPKFSAQLYEAEVLEDVRLNPPVPLIQLNATDLDSGINGNIHYSIMSGNENGKYFLPLELHYVTFNFFRCVPNWIGYRNTVRP